VLRVESGRDVAAVDVEARTTDAPGVSTILAPFDRLTPCPRPTVWRRGSRQRLRHVIGALDGAWPEMPLASLTTVASAPWPHQLVPALAMTCGRGVRVLIADEVGLGKTLAAGIAIMELAARSLAPRVLVLTPAGLRDQWRAELHRHLGTTADITDAAALATLTREVPAHCSPWIGRSCRILSLDFAKQPGVLNSLAGESWDVLVIDEAHGVSGESQRAAAVRALALQARFVLLLTATPHNGTRLSFRNLVELGVHDSHDQLLWVQRGRNDLGYPQARPTRIWRLQLDPDEIILRRALHAYAARVDAARRPEARLAMLVLKKRALSSPDALLCSLRRRLAHLSAAEPVVTSPQLPFEAGEIGEDDCHEPAVLAAPGLDVGNERRELQRLIDLATRATRTSVKYRTLERMVTETAEAAVVFTEYRDTLEIVESRLSRLTAVTVLHGGLDRSARREAVRQFTNGDARMLVATDAAAEGLNLQARCRFVVHFDLPWSPTTLAQRVGRVDRIGQTRPVRVWQFTAGGHEESVIAALARRVRRIHTDLGKAVPQEWSRLPADPSEDADDPHIPARIDVNDLANVATAVAASAALIRDFRARVQSRTRSSTGSRSRGIPWIRSSRARSVVGRGVVILFGASPVGRGDARAHVAIHVSLHRVPPESPKTWLGRLALHAARHAADALPSALDLRARAADREKLLIARLESERHRLYTRWQPSLFDQRAARVVDVARHEIATRLEIHRGRLAELYRNDERPTLEPLFALIVE
jgi:superfamily II DNA or RNA helicase